MSDDIPGLGVRPMPVLQDVTTGRIIEGGYAPDGRVTLVEGPWRVLVMRRWPVGYTAEGLGLRVWIPEAGPSLALDQERRAGRLGWADYAARYVQEQVDLAESGRKVAAYHYAPPATAGDPLRRSKVMVPDGPLGALRRMATWAPPVLLCWEEQGARCHRALLAELVRGTPPAMVRSMARMEGADEALDRALQERRADAAGS